MKRIDSIHPEISGNKFKLKHNLSFARKQRVFGKRAFKPVHKLGLSFGGYAKINRELISFINKFEKLNGIPLDPIYTGKMMFGIYGLLKQNYFKEGVTIIALHTCGLQGVEGMKLKMEKLANIDF